VYALFTLLRTFQITTVRTENSVGCYFGCEQFSRNLLQLDLCEALVRYGRNPLRRIGGGLQELAAEKGRLQVSEAPPQSVARISQPSTPADYEYHRVLFPKLKAGNWALYCASGTCARHDLNLNQRFPPPGTSSRPAINAARDCVTCRLLETSGPYTRFRLRFDPEPHIRTRTARSRGDGFSRP
jgi:hypothetical protein